MAETVRCAVVGLGRAGFSHAENLVNNVKGAELAVVAATRKEHAEAVASRLGVRHATNTVNDIFENPEIDAVIIATPTATHKQLIQRAAESGKHIFVEKPITRTSEEAEETIRIIREHRVMCQVGFMRRFDPAYAEAKKRVDAGDIGKPIYFKGIGRDPGSPPFDYMKHSGGIFLDLCIHDYDIARYLMGAEVASVTAFGRILAHPFLEECRDVDQALTHLTFHSGAMGDIEGSRNAFYGYDIRGEIMGTEGTIQIGSLRHHDVKIMTAKGKTHDLIPDFPTRFKDAFCLQLQSFVDSIRNRQAPAVSAADAKIALQIAEAATKSFRTGTTVQVAADQPE